MRSKLSLLFLFMMVISGHAYSAVTSYDYTFTANDIHSANFHTKLNRNFSQSLTGGINNINSSNIVNDSLSEADMADEINPRIRTYEGAACEFVYTGLIPATDTDLTTDISAGTAYPRGYRIIKNSATSHTFTASKWTYVDLDQNGDFQYSEVAIGGSAPSVASNSIRLARVSTDTSQVLAVQDLRTTSCSNGPFSIIRDASGEASLGDILSLGAGGWESGLSITTKDASSVYINSGAAYINGEYRRVSGRLTVDGAIVAAPLSNQSGIDSGSLVANTNYYIYGVADLAGEDDLTGVLSTSASNPSGATNYRRLGEVSTDASASFASSDAYSVSYLGKFLQYKYITTGEVKTGTTQIPSDDSAPLITEGDEYMRLNFTPVDENSVLTIEALGNFGASLNNTDIITTIYANSTLVGVCGIQAQPSGNQSVGIYPCKVVIRAGTTSNIVFSYRAGPVQAATTTFNGYNGARKMGGYFSSSLTVKESQK